MFYFKQLFSIFAEFRIVPIHVPDEIRLSEHDVQSMFIQLAPLVLPVFVEVIHLLTQATSRLSRDASLRVDHNPGHLLSHALPLDPDLFMVQAQSQSGEILFTAADQTGDLFICGISGKSQIVRITGKSQVMAQAVLPE